MSLYLLDTNALSRLIKGRDLQLKEKIKTNLADCRISAVPLMELIYGAERRPDMPVLQERLRTLREMFPDVEAFDEHAARHAGIVRAHLSTLKPNAQPIGHYDVLLAGHALALGAIVVTHNTKEFSRVPGLVLEDWQGKE